MKDENEKNGLPDFSGEDYEPLTDDENAWMSLLHDPQVKKLTKTQVFYNDGSIGPTPYTKGIMEDFAISPEERYD